MRLSARTVDLVTTQLAADLRSGVLAIFDGARPSSPESAATFKDPLVRIPLNDVPPPVNGLIVMEDLPSVEITRSGDATWGQLQTASGQVIADVTVGTAKDESAEVIVSRTSFERGGLCAGSFVTLRLPVGT